MSTESYLTEIKVLALGDSATWEFVVYQGDKVTILDLTGYAAWVTYWQAGDDTTMAVKQARIKDAANGKVWVEWDEDEPPDTAANDNTTWMFQLTLLDVGDDDGSPLRYGTVTIPAIARKAVYLA